MNAFGNQPSLSAGREPVARPLVFYDGGCPLCRREIAHYQRIDADDRLDWIDISREPERVRNYGLSVARALQRLHVLDAGGAWPA